MSPHTGIAQSRDMADARLSETEQDGITCDVIAEAADDFDLRAGGRRFQRKRGGETGGLHLACLVHPCGNTADHHDHPDRLPAAALRISTSMVA
jgi:hypothetical protein